MSSTTRRTVSYTHLDVYKRQAFAPIFIPVILILFSTVTSMVYTGEPNMATKLIGFFGSPVIAISIALLVSMYGLVGDKSRSEVQDILERGIRSCGTVILITGAGGAFGNIIKSSGIGVRRNISYDYDSSLNFQFCCS